MLVRKGGLARRGVVRSLVRAGMGCPTRTEAEQEQRREQSQQSRASWVSFGHMLRSVYLGVPGAGSEWEGRARCTACGAGADRLGAAGQSEARTRPGRGQSDGPSDGAANEDGRRHRRGGWVGGWQAGIRMGWDRGWEAWHGRHGMGWDGRQQKAVVEVQTRAQEAAALVPKRVPLPAWASRLWHIFRLIGLAVDRVAASGMAGWPGCGAVQRRGSLSPHLAAAPRLTIPRRGRRARSRRRRAFMAHGASDVFLYFPSALSPFPPHATPTDCRLQGPAARGLGGFVRSVGLPPGGGHGGELLHRQSTPALYIT